MPLLGVASDLHLEFGAMNPEFFDWRGDILLLAGDIAEDDHLTKHCDDFWSRASRMANDVFVIAGNHEFYGSEIDTTVDHIRDYLKQFPNIRLLDNEGVLSHGVMIYGSTLWSDFDRGNPLTMWDAQQRMNDYRKIRFKKGGFRRINPNEIAALHNDSLFKLISFLEAQRANLPVCVMTHHAPSLQSIAPQYVNNSLNGAYASDLEDLIAEYTQIKAWVHGHIHTYADYEIEQCRVMVNARGYPGERNTDKYGAYEVKHFHIEATQ